MLFGIKDASNLTVIPSGTTKPIMYANYCNTSDINFKADSVYAMLKGVKSIRWDRNKEGTFKTEMEIFDLKWIALLLGTTFVTGATPYAKREILPVIGGTATLTSTPKVGTLAIFKVDATDQVTHLAEQVVGVPTSTPDKYSIASLVMTFNQTTTFTDNLGYVVAYYMIDSAITASTLTVNVNQYPSNYKIYGDTMVRGTDGNDKFVQFCLPNAKPKTDITLNFNVDSPTKLSVEWDKM